MTAHDHPAFVPGCYRCDLSRAEVIAQQPGPPPEKPQYLCAHEGGPPKTAANTEPPAEAAL